MSAASHPLLRAALGVFSVWSLGVLVVVEAGLGGRWSLHPDAQPEPGQIPEVRLVSGVGGVSGFDDYASIVQRPLFSEDRRPGAAEEGAAEDPAANTVVPLNLVVTSIVITEARRIAIVTDPESKRSQSVSVGSALEGDQSSWRLVELEPRQAVFEGPGGRNTLDLRVFDGQGGEPPTPMAQPASPREGNAAPPPNATNGQKGEEDGRPQGETVVEADSPEARAEQIRRRIEERRRQMREEAERANAERGQ